MRNTNSKNHSNKRYYSLTPALNWKNCFFKLLKLMEMEYLTHNLDLWEKYGFSKEEIKVIKQEHNKKF